MERGGQKAVEGEGGWNWSRFSTAVERKIYGGGKRISYLRLKIGIRGRILVSISTLVLVAQVSVVVLDAPVSQAAGAIFLCNNERIENSRKMHIECSRGKCVLDCCCFLSLSVFFFQRSENEWNKTGKFLCLNARCTCLV